MSSAEQFRALHGAETPLVLPNVWDAVTARLVVECGGKALATSSAATAWAQGFSDGELLPLESLIRIVAGILRVVSVPVSVDLERGYGEAAEAAVELAELGVAGVNLEDGAGRAEDFSATLGSVRAALRRRGLDLFLNARCDLLLEGAVESDGTLDELVRRGKLYSQAGADGFFIPGVTASASLRRISHGVPLPLNVWAAEALGPVETLRDAGVRRVSVGTRLALHALSAAAQDVKALLAGRWARPVPPPFLTSQELNGWFRRDGA